MKLSTTLISFIVFLLFSCGPSAEEKIKVREDLNSAIVETKTQLEGLQNRLIFFEANLAAAEDKLVGIKGFQFLRTSDERAKQVIDQSLVIAELNKEIDNIKERIQATHQRLDRHVSDFEKLK